MKLPKHQMELAFSDLKKLVLQRSTELSLDHIKNYSPYAPPTETTAYLAGKVAGMAEFLLWAKTETDRLYKLEGAEEE